MKDLTCEDVQDCPGGRRCMCIIRIATATITAEACACRSTHMEAAVEWVATRLKAHDEEMRSDGIEVFGVRWTASRANPAGAPPVPVAATRSESLVRVARRDRILKYDDDDDDDADRHLHSFCEDCQFFCCIDWGCLTPSTLV